MWQAFPCGFDCRFIPLKIQVASGVEDFGVLGLHGRRQHDIRVIDGVGGEVLDHYGEQVFPGEAPAQGLLLWRARAGIGAIDHYRFDGRIFEVQQVLAHLCVRQGTRGGRSQVPGSKFHHVRGKCRCGTVDHATSGKGEVARHCRNCVDCPAGHAATRVPLHTIGDTNGTRSGSRQALS